MSGLRELRKAVGLTQAALADGLGISQTAVAKWERGETLPTLDKLPEIACVLGCSLDVLVYSMVGGDPHGSRLHPTDVGDQG